MCSELELFNSIKYFQVKNHHEVDVLHFVSPLLSFCCYEAVRSWSIMGNKTNKRKKEKKKK